MFDLSNMSKARKDQRFERLFRASIIVGSLLILAVLALGLWMALAPPSEHVDVGVVLATGALALFTALLWFAAAISALCPYRDFDIDRC